MKTKRIITSMTIVILGVCVCVCLSVCAITTLSNSGPTARVRMTERYAGTREEKTAEAIPTETTTPEPTSTRTPVPLPTDTLDPSITPPTPTATETATATGTNTATATNSPTPSKTTVPPILLEDIYANFKSMTEMQFKEYKDGIMGKKVIDFVKVGNVDENGKVFLSGSWSDGIFSLYDMCMIVISVPKDTALSFSTGDELELDATVYGLVGNYGYYYNCENTLLLTYNSHK